MAQNPTFDTTTPTIALVTGANKGIGREIARQLAALGMTVLLSARDERRGAQAAAELRAEGGEVIPLVLDVTDMVSVGAAAKTVEARFGRLDVLVNNAGITGPRSEQVPSTANVDTVREVFETNVFGVLTVTGAFLPLLLRSVAPRVVNVSSGVGSLTAMSDPDGRFAPMPASVAYVPSKTALNAMTVQFARELRGRVLVNAADPGYCATDLSEHSGYRTAAQGAEIAVRLATLKDDGPTGGFFDEEGALAW
ncbi:SDR family oxidoreductase [Actinopolymorpha pittospori]|uniref:NAD(P)-dependent dehydrogenase (Short-subunit alcohol dehydrogenase family) n=1 Tax=Actinopolymorpha pittospori TaxID=648752 RepID=A0A927R7S9_9ACTN|nr:SDR family oxidoreductase [Actinopolymorpha pittospori]MBE1604564.1 NAD(P)-dependent dehydrogenase (short-subunit alcohol dehydrogenase family) [Actinopolymorpha pittospori]